MDWLARLGSFFRSPAAQEADSGLCSTDWNVRLSSIAISYEVGLSAARESSFGAVLLLGEASWRMVEGARHQLTLRCLSLHAALASTLSNSSLGRPRDLAGTELSAASYKRIAVESELGFDFPAAIAGGADCWQLEVQNHLLSIYLDPEGITLLSQLVDQIRASRPAAAPRERTRPAEDVVQDLASSILIDGE